MVDDQVDNDDENMWCETVLLCHASFNGTTNKLPQAAPLSSVCFLSSCGNGDDLGHDVEKIMSCARETLFYIFDMFVCH